MGVPSRSSGRKITMRHRPPSSCPTTARQPSLFGYAPSEGWSQSPVLPWAQLAYETGLSAGSTAMEPPPGVAPGSLPYRGGASLTMLWGRQNWRP